MDRAKLKAMMTGMDSVIDEMLTTVPADLLEQVQSMSEVDLLRGTMHRVLGDLMHVYGLLADALKRCGVCRDSGQTCGHCLATSMQVHELLEQTVTTACVTRAATRPGTRIAASREHEAELAAGKDRSNG